MEQHQYTNYVKEHGNYMRALAIHMSSNNEDAKDLEQDTWVKIFENCNSYDDRNKFRNWASVIMRNVFLNNYRQRLRRGVNIDANDCNLIDSNENDDGYNEDLYGYLKFLSKEKSSVVYLYLKGFSYEEIANRLSIPLGTVKSRLYGSKKRLHLLLKPY